jgi:hypothetical protein
MIDWQSGRSDRQPACSGAVRHHADPPEVPRAAVGMERARAHELRRSLRIHIRSRFGDRLLEAARTHVESRRVSEDGCTRETDLLQLSRTRRLHRCVYSPGPLAWNRLSPLGLRAADRKPGSRLRARTVLRLPAGLFEHPPDVLRLRAAHSNRTFADPTRPRLARVDGERRGLDSRSMGRIPGPGEAHRSSLRSSNSLFRPIRMAGAVPIRSLVRCSTRRWSSRAPAPIALVRVVTRAAVTAFVRDPAPDLLRCLHRRGRARRKPAPRSRSAATPELRRHRIPGDAPL